MNWRGKQTLVAALTVLLICGLLLMPAEAKAEGALPNGFSGMDSVNLTVDEGYAWHKMTDEEAEAYHLEAYKDTDVYLAGNSGTTAKNVSNLAITVSEPGQLSFEYAISMQSSGSYFICYQINDMVSVGDEYDKYAWYSKHNVPTETGWPAYTVNVTESDLENGPATIYLAYVRKAGRGEGIQDGEAYYNYVAVRNVSFISGNRTDVVQGYDPAMGSITVDGEVVNEFKVGDTYQLKATANDGYRFYGWVKHNGNSAEFQTVASGLLEITVDPTSYYTPVFAEEGTYLLRKGAEFYDSTCSVKSVFEEAQAGEVIVLLDDYELEEDITVPAGVTFYIPFRSAWEKEEGGYYDTLGNFILKYHFSDKNNKLCHTSIAQESETYVRLTIPTERNLSIDGQVVIGSVIGYASQRYQGHVSGAHGRITNNGMITVNGSGTLSCYGIVDGDGKVTVKDNGILKESFIIGDFAGGSNTLNLFSTSQMPFKRFSMQSVQCDLEMTAKASLMAMMSVWADKVYNEAEVILVGDSQDAAFRPDGALIDTVALRRTYNSEKTLTDGNGLLDVTGIGRTEWTFSGGLTFQPLTVRVGSISVDTGESDFTIPYNFKINMIAGTYSIPNGIRIMPGAEVNIESGATAVIGGRLMILDGLVQTDMSTDRYPTREELVAGGFSGSGELTVNGTLIMKAESSLGGLVKSDGTGRLTLEEGVYVNNSGTFSNLDVKMDLVDHPYDLYSSEGGVAAKTAEGTLIRIDNWVQQDGALGEYDENTTWFNLPARIYDGNGVQGVTPGRTYVASPLNGEAYAEYEVDYLYVEDNVFGRDKTDGKYKYLTESGYREMTPAHEDISRLVVAKWTDSEMVEDTVPVAEPVVCGSSNSSALTYNATVIFETRKNGAATELFNLQAVDRDSYAAKEQEFVFLVQYTVEGSEVATTVDPVDGVFTIPAEAIGVTIQSTVLGDVSGDGKLSGTDLLKVKQHSVGKITIDGIHILAADVSGDGKYSGTDLLKFKQWSVGKILNF